MARHMSHPPSPRSTCTHSPADVLQRCIAGPRSIGAASSGRALDRRSVEIIIVLDCAADGAARGGPAHALQRSASSWYDHALHIAVQEHAGRPRERARHGLVRPNWCMSGWWGRLRY